MSERNSLKGVEECFIICLRCPLILTLGMRRIKGLGLGFRITYDVFYKAGTPGGIVFNNKAN
ncbi:MAG: hypothetical protein AT712_03965 [Caldivirga sp. CIS_19]|nr:MAG: hypothetical protein AT712_03965 [Caldivirga sp. CIS_19]